MSVVQQRWIRGVRSPAVLVGDRTKVRGGRRSNRSSSGITRVLASILQRGHGTFRDLRTLGYPDKPADVSFAEITRRVIKLWEQDDFQLGKVVERAVLRSLEMQRHLTNATKLG